ncbi:hypothetical protein [Kluyvera intermedia]|uniref:hypothetical protein n=1 Tax=Kluyvera intermedia TaxID=61648 RepID=UPI00372D13F7
MATRIDPIQSEFTRGALAALNEVKTLALANATLTGVLVGADYAQMLLTSFNVLIDPLIEKHSAVTNGPQTIQTDEQYPYVCAVVEKVTSITRLAHNSYRVDVIAFDLYTDEIFPHSRTFKTSKSARKFRPGTPFTFKRLMDFDDGVPF